MTLTLVKQFRRKRPVQVKVSWHSDRQCWLIRSYRNNRKMGLADRVFLLDVTQELDHGKTVLVGVPVAYAKTTTSGKNLTYKPTFVGWFYGRGRRAGARFKGADFAEFIGYQVKVYSLKI